MGEAKGVGKKKWVLLTFQIKNRLKKFRNKFYKPIVAPLLAEKQQLVFPVSGYRLTNENKWVWS